MLAVVEGSSLGSIRMDLTTESALHYSLHYSSRQAILCSVRLQDIGSIAQFRLLQPHVLYLIISMPSNQVLSLSPELPILQDLLDLGFLVIIDYHWWDVGLDSIIQIRLE